MRFGASSLIADLPRLMPAAFIGVNKFRAFERNFAMWLLLNCNTMQRLEKWRECGNQHATKLEKGQWQWAGCVDLVCLAWRLRFR